MNDLSTESMWLSLHPTLGISLMDHLFERLDGVYPGKWKSAFKSAADIQNWRIVWSCAFDHHKITPQEIKAGLDNLPVTNPDWIPQLGQFITACRFKEVKHPSHRKYAELPKPNYPKGKALENLAKMKAMLNKSPLMERAA